MNTKKFILGILIFALIIEVALTVICFFAPVKGLALFGMTYSTETAFLAFIIAWFLLLVSALIVYILFLLKNNNSNTVVLINMLAIWWIALGLGVFIMFQKIDNLLLDSIKGLLLFVFNYKYAKELKGR